MWYCYLIYHLNLHLQFLKVCHQLLQQQLHRTAELSVDVTIEDSEKKEPMECSMDTPLDIATHRKDKVTKRRLDCLSSHDFHLALLRS
jgi:hypothetical protein